MASASEDHVRRNSSWPLMTWLQSLMRVDKWIPSCSTLQGIWQGTPPMTRTQAVLLWRPWTTTSMDWKLPPSQDSAGCCRGTGIIWGPSDLQCPTKIVLGPTLFLIYINDLSKNIKSQVRLFADNTILFCKIKSQRDSSILQEDLNPLECWEKNWQMSFNINKCHVLTVSRKRKQISTKYSLNGQVLRRVEKAKYLGMESTKDLNWKPHIRTITAKVNRTNVFTQWNLRGYKESPKKVLQRHSETNPRVCCPSVGPPPKAPAGQTGVGTKEIWMKHLWWLQPYLQCLSPGQNAELRSPATQARV